MKNQESRIREKFGNLKRIYKKSEEKKEKKQNRYTNVI